jgi:hypothetical protein
MSTTPSRRKGLRRKPRAAWIRYASLPFFWLLFVPLTRLFPRRWARVLSRGLSKVLGNFAQYEPNGHDVFACAYFKSGTNWTMQIAVQIAYRGRAEFAHIHDIVPWPDMPDRARYAVPVTDDSAARESPTALRVIKTHLALGQVPYARSARYICVVRDPKDVFVSSYHFVRSIALGPAMPSVAGWLDAYLSADAALGSWAEHLHSYWRARDRDNVLFLTYEAMRRDLPGTVDKIAALMGVTLTPAEKLAVVERSTFDYMKKNSHKFDSPTSPLGSAKGAMVRRGQHGKSGELISAADQRRIDDYWRAELRRLGCDFPYDAAFAESPAELPIADPAGAAPLPAR